MVVAVPILPETFSFVLESRLGRAERMEIKWKMNRNDRMKMNEVTLGPAWDIWVCGCPWYPSISHLAASR